MTSSFNLDMGSAAPAAHAFDGVIATLRRGCRSACIALIGDSTGDGLLVGAGTQVDEWPQVFIKRLAADYPAYTLQERRWNNTNQGYDPAITWSVGVGDVQGNGDRFAAFAGAGALQYQGAAITGDIDIRLRVLPNTWTPGGAQTLAAKWEAASNNRSWLLLLNPTGSLSLNWSTDGTTSVGAKTSTAIAQSGTGFVAGQPFWVRATLKVNNGAAGNDVTFYTSPDGVTFTQLGTTVTSAGTTSIFAGVAPYQVGSFTSGVTSPYSGNVYLVNVRSGLASQQSVVAPLLDDWDYYSGGPTTVSFGGAPVLTLLNGSTSGQNVAYFDDPTRRPIVHQPAGQMLVIINTAHNDFTQSRQLWLTNYGAMVTNIKSLVPNVPILAIAQNPTGIGGTFSLTQQDHEIRAARGAILLQWAASQAGVYSFDAWPLLQPADTVDQLHPTSGPGSGSEHWGRGLYSRITQAT